MPNQITDLEDLEVFEAEAKKNLLPLYHNRQALREKILEAVADERLVLLAEHYDILDKIVLYSNEDLGVRLRLHIFGEGYFDRPHNHRWSYASCILSGGYRHIIFNLDALPDAPEVKNLRPVLIREEKAGDFYALHHSQYHSVVAGPNTVTLVWRGPSRTDKFCVMDRMTNEAWWQYGASVESEEEKKKKRMDRKQLDLLLERLLKMGII